MSDGLAADWLASGSELAAAVAAESKAETAATAAAAAAAAAATAAAAAEAMAKENQAIEAADAEAATAEGARRAREEALAAERREDEMKLTTLLAGVDSISGEQLQLLLQASAGGGVGGHVGRRVPGGVNGSGGRGRG